jgi:hypothetical protein
VTFYIIGLSKENWPTKREKVKMLKMKFKLEINGVIEDIADCEMLRLPKREVTKYACG